MTIREHQSFKTRIAQQIGLAESVFIHHLHYWMENGKEKYREKDVMWFHTTYADLIEKGGMPLTVMQLKHMMLKLEKDQVIFSEFLPKNKGKRYRLNYKHKIIKKYYPKNPVQISSTVVQKSTTSRSDIIDSRSEINPPIITTKKQQKKQYRNNPGDSNLVSQGSKEQGKNNKRNKTQKSERYVDASDPKNWKDTDLDHIKSWEDTPIIIAPDTAELFRFGGWQLNKLKSWLSSHEYSTEYLRIIWEQSVADAGKPAQDKKKPRLYLETVFLNKLQNTG